LSEQVLTESGKWIAGASGLIVAVGTAVWKLVNWLFNHSAKHRALQESLDILSKEGPEYKKLVDRVVVVEAAVKDHETAVKECMTFKDCEELRASCSALRCEIRDNQNRAIEENGASLKRIEPELVNMRIALEKLATHQEHVLDYIKSQKEKG
jgi:hypothetical protein